MNIHSPRRHLRPGWHHVMWAFFALWCAWSPTMAWAQDKAPTHPYGLSDYEWRLVKDKMDKHGLTPLPKEAARGRVIEAVIVETEDVFTPDDPFPDILNILHITSRPFVIRREVLLKEGEPYVPETASQSERNLRGPVILSVALVLPMKGSAPDKVKLLVVTRDVWSLRAGYDFQFVAGNLDFLSVSFSENNIAGRHKFASINTLLRPATFRIGQTYADPRVWGTRLSFAETFSVPFNRETGEPEGFSAAMSFGQPLFSLRTRWSWDLDLSASTSIGRSFAGGQLRTLTVADPPQAPALDFAGTADALNQSAADLILGASGRPSERFAFPPTASVEMPFVFRQRFLELELTTTRSFGYETKQNVTLGYELGVQRFAFGESDAQRDSFTPAQVAAFENNLLPRSERFGAIFASYRLFTPDFVQLRNFETLALPEDFRFGPTFSLSVGHADPLLGSQFRFDTLAVSTSYRWLFGDRQSNPSRHADVFSIGASANTRIQNGEAQDNDLGAAVRNYSPTFFGGRLVTRAGFLIRFNDQSNSLAAVGGDGGLRGYVSGQFLVRSSITANVEWRTLPLELFSFQFGAVAFYDMAWLSEEQRLRDLFFRHSTGLGIRALSPYTDRIVFRFDYGVPLTEGLPGRLTVSFEQAF